MKRPGGSTGLTEDIADLNSLLRKFEGLRIWSAKGKPAPQKPLLVLLALGKLSQGEERLSFRAFCDRLPELVKQFWPDRAPPKPEHPFWRLRNDHVWKVDHQEQIRVNLRGDALRSDLKDHNALGGFTDDVLRILKSNPKNIESLVSQILHLNFPAHRHEEILDAVGLAPSRFMIDHQRPWRAPNFRDEVLNAYDFRCCVCGYDLRVGDKPTGLEAAHIRAHYAFGPDEVPNGLSLCVMHHSTFDRGVFTVQDDGRTIKCSPRLSGTSRKEWLTDFDGQKITDPLDSENRPAEKHLAWHRENIFLRPL